MARAGCSARQLHQTGRAAWGFRDFLHLPAAKENRNGSRRTLALQHIAQFPIFNCSLKLPSSEKTIVGNPSKDLLETEGALRVIIESLIDGQRGFQNIGEELQDETLKRYFLQESLKRAEFRGELENILHQEGVRDVQETGSPAGTFVRLFTRLKTAMGAGPHALLETAEEAESEARQAYEDALDKFLPAPIRDVLIQQAAHIQKSHGYVKAARDATT
jgi:uncharacterized protein (TIGR02284 family)